MAEENATQDMDALEEVSVESENDDVTYGLETENNTSDEASEEKYVSPREKAIDAILSRGRDEESDDSSEESELVEPPEEPQYAEEPEQSQNPSPVWFDGERWLTKVKVDGNEIEVPFNDLQNSHQKDKASQQRFEQAAQYGRQIQAREQQLNAHIQQLQQQQRMQQQPPQDAAEEVEDSSDLIKKYHEALYEDDAEKASDLFKTLTKQGRTQATPNVQEVVNQEIGRQFNQMQRQAEQQKQWAYHKSLEDSVKWFESEYPDVAGAAELRAIADNRTVTLTQEHPDWTPQQIIQEAAESTREWAKSFLEPDKQNERVSRKRKIVQHPKAASASAQIGEDDPVPQTPAQIIEEMRRVRGQI